MLLNLWNRRLGGSWISGPLPIVVNNMWRCICISVHDPRIAYDSFLLHLQTGIFMNWNTYNWAFVYIYFLCCILYRSLKYLLHALIKKNKVSTKVISSYYKWSLFVDSLGKTYMLRFLLRLLCWSSWKSPSDRWATTNKNLFSLHTQIKMDECRELHGGCGHIFFFIIWIIRLLQFYTKHKNKYCTT